MASASVTQRQDSLLDLAARRWRVFLAGVAFGLALSVSYVLVSGPSYVSSASVLVTATGAADTAQVANGQGNRDELNLQTEAQLVTSTAVADRARKALGTKESAAALVDAVSTEVPANTSVLRISYAGASPEEARNGAQAFAEAYLAARAATAEETIGEQVTVVEEQIAGVRARLEEAAAAASSANPDSSTATVAQSEADVLTEQLSGLTRRLADLNSLAVTPGRVIVGAGVPASPSGPPAVLVLVAGLVAGAAMGFALALIRDRSDQRIRRAEDVERVADLPTFAIGGTSRQQRLEQSPADTRREFRRLRNALVSALAADRRIVLVTAVGRPQTPSAVSYGLATALAQGENSVTLVGADADGAQVVTAVSGDDAPGLAEVLAGTRRLTDVVQAAPHLPNLAVLPPGGSAAELSERLPGKQVVGVLTALRRSSDFVVVQAPSVTVSADAQTIGRTADAAVLVLEAGRARVDELGNALAELAQVGITQVWCVLVPHEKHPPASDSEADLPDLAPSAERVVAEVAAVGAATPAPARKGSGTSARTRRK